MAEINFGERVFTLGEFRALTADLPDDSKMVIETIDLESGDTQDLYPFYVDNIDGVKLENGAVVSEIRICQMDNKNG